MNSIKLKLIISTLLIILSISCITQNNNIKLFRIAFYNLENYFDIYNDNTKNDNDFTPIGFKRWSKKRFNKKTSNLYKTILAIGNNKPVAIIGIAEIENKYCIEELLYKTPLKLLPYSYIHYESNDLRGIDVALLYNNKQFKPIFHKAIKVIIPDKSPIYTRDILYVKGVLSTIDTLHIFICHLPSRLGGALQSSFKRNYVAQIIRQCTDSIFDINKSSKIIIMGDMNDDPYNESMSLYLCNKNSYLINLMLNILKREGIGTIKHNAFWNVFDQIIVSHNLIENKYPYVKDSSAYIFRQDFLFQNDAKYGGKKLFRTHEGAKYLGGYSDHLPVYIDIISNNKQ